MEPDRTVREMAPLLFCLPTSLADGAGAGAGPVIDSSRPQNCSYSCRAAA